MVPVATPEELKPLETEFGELLAKRKRYWWLRVVEALFYSLVVTTIGYFGFNLISGAILCGVGYLVIRLGYPRGDIDARLQEIETTFQRQDLKILKDPANNVTVYLKNIDGQDK